MKKIKIVHSTRRCGQKGGPWCGLNCSFRVTLPLAPWNIPDSCILGACSSNDITDITPTKKCPGPGVYELVKMEKKT